MLRFGVSLIVFVIVVGGLILWVGMKASMRK